MCQSTKNVKIKFKIVVSFQRDATQLKENYQK